jgi:hypothetical protein
MKNNNWKYSVWKVDSIVNACFVNICWFVGDLFIEFDPKSILSGRSNCFVFSCSYVSCVDVNGWSW